MSDQMVDNPRRAWLQTLLDGMDATLQSMRPVLEQPASDFGSGTVWSGTAAARAFESDIAGRSRSVHTLTDGLRSTVQNALKAEPLKVSEAQARQMRLDHQRGP